jgi:hypothetical protein
LATEPLTANSKLLKKDNDEMKTFTSPEDPAATRFLSGAASLDDAIDQAFSELPRKVRTLLRQWAVQDEPYKHGKPIRIQTLAKKAKMY